MNKGVSIIIVNFNTPKLTLECIRAILVNPPKHNFEIIVVDNGSEEKLKFTNHSNKIKYIKLPKNFGFSVANNIGIRERKMEYVFLLNSDAVATGKAIDELLDFAEKHEDAGVIAPKLLNSDLSEQPSVYYLPSIVRAIEAYFLGKEYLVQKYAPQVGVPTRIEAAVGAAFLVTPKAISRVGLLDEKFFMYFEDIDYCKRVRESGLEVYYLPNIKVIHHHGRSGNSKANELLIESAKKYFGFVRYYLYTFVLWFGQKVKKIFA